MGKLIMITGPSGVGKGPLVKTLECYLKALRKKLTKHVLFNTRDLRENEVQGETYWYTFMWDKVKGDWSNGNVTYDRNKAIENLENIATRANEDGARFDIFTVRDDLQGLNYSVLKKELLKNDIVLLEIDQDKADDVVKFCKEDGFDVKRIFVSPLSGVDYSGCSTDADRAVLTEKTMRDKLTKRGRDGKADILKRAGRAFDEIKKAEMLAKQGKIDILTNHSGEDAKEEWSALQKRVGGIPECYKYGEQNAQFRDEIDNMFRKFLVLIFPEIPTHVCKESLNGGCICGFCGRRYHDIERTEGNYGCGCGSVVEWCRRCHEWERYDEATGLTIKRTDMW